MEPICHSLVLSPSSGHIVLSFFEWKWPLGVFLSDDFWNFLSAYSLSWPWLISLSAAEETRMFDA